MNGIVYLNGEFIDAAAAKVSAFDRGFIFGDGIYEVVPVLNGRLVDREDFWERFERSLAAIELSLPLSKSDFGGRFRGSGLAKQPKRRRRLYAGHPRRRR